jgi:hypothetical protein
MEAIEKLRADFDVFDETTGFAFGAGAQNTAAIVDDDFRALHAKLPVVLHSTPTRCLCAYASRLGFLGADNVNKSG